MQFDGARVVITGAGGGVGTALCAAFAEAGLEHLVIGFEAATATDVIRRLRAFAQAAMPT